MSYKKGDLKITIGGCSHSECDGEPECLFTQERFWVHDSREEFFRFDDPKKPPEEKHGAYLPHSCDEWFIGGREEVEALVADLQKALEVL